MYGNVKYTYIKNAFLKVSLMILQEVVGEALIGFQDAIILLLFKPAPHPTTAITSLSTVANYKFDG